jgi:hypothetical protein
MKRLILAALSAMFLLQPTVASAQLAPVPDATEYLQWVGKGDAVVATWGGVYLGPYLGAFATPGSPTSPSFSLYCVDYAHTAGSQWVQSTSLASSSVDLSGTRLGDYGAYQQAAYLSSLFDGYVGDPTQRTIWSGLHAAIWSITTPGFGPTLNTATAGWQSYFLGLAVPTSFGSDWYVLSPDQGYNGQEFLVRTASVPEPGTLLLIGSGVLLLVGFNRRRMKDVLFEV